MLPCCHQADTWIRSHRLLMQGVNKLDANLLSRWQQVYKYQVESSLIFTDLTQLDKANIQASLQLDDTLASSR